MNKEQISTELRSKGISPTQPRVVLLDYIRQHRIHPTIDTIYTDLLPEYPNLSRTTVYNTLRLFAEKGLCQALTIDERQICYDGETHPHGHFLCTCCGQIYDVCDEQYQPTELPEMEGFDVQEVHYYFKGICPKCKESNNKL